MKGKIENVILALETLKTDDVVDEEAIDQIKEYIKENLVERSLGKSLILNRQDLSESAHALGVWGSIESAVGESLGNHNAYLIVDAQTTKEALEASKDAIDREREYGERLDAKEEGEL